MGLLTFITQACDALAATTSPSIDAMGLRMVIALATIMLVWFGVQEALASASGGSGFSMARFVNLFMLLTFAYVMVRFYDNSIPGVGFSLKGFINGGAQYLVSVIGNDSVTQMHATLAQVQATAGPGIIKSITDPYFALVFFFIQVMLGVLRCDPEFDRRIWSDRQHSGGYVWAHHDPLDGASKRQHFSSGDGCAPSSVSASTRSLPRPFFPFWLSYSPLSPED